MPIPLGVLAVLSVFTLAAAPAAGGWGPARHRTPRLYRCKVTVGVGAPRQHTAASTAAAHPGLAWRA